MKTALFDRHVALLAKMVDFAGFEMPLHYGSPLKEHLAVRQAVGLFDISHMGVIEVSGLDAGKLLEKLSTNKILSKEKHVAIYTVWAFEDGGCVDDLLVYCEDETHFFIVVNAINRTKSLNHLKLYAKDFHVHIQDRYQDYGILALQGPNALALISPLFLEAKHLKKMHFTPVHYHGQKLILSRTGYTGELGFEIYGPNPLIAELFDWFMNEGPPFSLKPVGLAARDTLRLEMGYCLYGHEISESISVNESLANWTIHLEKQFIGKEKIISSKQPRHEYGIILEDGKIARERYPVFKDNLLIGHVTSGNYSPTLQKAIAIIIVNTELKMKDLVEIEIRNLKVAAHVTRLPFIN